MLKRLIPHVCITLSLFLVTYGILNEFNPSLFSKDFFKFALLAFVAASVTASGFLIAQNRKE